MGISLGYFLAQQGVKVDIFEASPVLGGLAGPLMLQDGTAVDRFYHAILSSDSHLRQLCTDLNIADKLRFRETRMGFYYQGQIYSMNTVMEFLRFPPLGWLDRFRLGLTVMYAQWIKDWQELEGISVEKWLKRLSGSVRLTISGDLCLRPNSMAALMILRPPTSGLAWCEPNLHAEEPAKRKRPVTLLAAILR